MAVANLDNPANIYMSVALNESAMSTSLARPFALPSTNYFFYGVKTVAGAGGLKRLIRYDWNLLVRDEF